MTLSISAGTALRLLCLPILLAGQGCAPQKQPQRLPDAESLMQEFKANAEGVKNNSAFAAGSKSARPPVHVDPSVPPATHPEHQHPHDAGDPKGC